jgi:hypothetical protein
MTIAFVISPSLRSPATVAGIKADLTPRLGGKTHRAVEFLSIIL